MNIPYYPVSLNLVGKQCLVVGGGRVAERKIITLIDCGAQVIVVSPRLSDGLVALAQEKKFRHRDREYRIEDLEGVFLVISATDSREVNRQVAADCFERNIVINVADDPEYCNFILPAVVRRGDLSISISTGGKSPALAKKIRQELEFQYGDEYTVLLEYLGRIRKQVLAEVPSQERRQEIFNRLVNMDLLELIKSGQEQEVEERINQCLSW